MVWDSSTSLAASSSGVRAISSRYMPTRSRSAISPPTARTLLAASRPASGGLTTGDGTGCHACSLAMDRAAGPRSDGLDPSRVPCIRWKQRLESGQNSQPAPIFLIMQYPVPPQRGSAHWRSGGKRRSETPCAVVLPTALPPRLSSVKTNLAGCRLPGWPIAPGCPALRMGVRWKVTGQGGDAATRRFGHECPHSPGEPPPPSAAPPPTAPLRPPGASPSFWRCSSAAG